jgi:hypothetical protein
MGGLKGASVHGVAECPIVFVGNVAIILTVFMANINSQLFVFVE